MGHQQAAPSAAEKHNDKPTQELLDLIEKQAKIIENQIVSSIVRNLILPDSLETRNFKLPVLTAPAA